MELLIVFLIIGKIQNEFKGQLDAGCGTAAGGGAGCLCGGGDSSGVLEEVERCR